MKSDTIARIRKLLNLANCPGATPAEAASAINKATRLAEAEGLSLGDIPADSGRTSGLLSHEIVVTPISPFSKLPGHLICRQIGAELMSVSGGNDRGLIFIGLPHQVQIATQAFRFLLAAMESAWKARPDKSIKDRTGYAHGFCQGVSAHLAAAIQRPGLIVAAGDYVRETLAPQLNAQVREKKARSKPKSVDRASYELGVTDGRRTRYSVPGLAPPARRIPAGFF